MEGAMAVGEEYPVARKLETFGGVVEVEWDPRGGMGMHGGLVYFIEFLKPKLCTGDAVGGV
jgi:hypothetical protein